MSKDILNKNDATTTKSGLKYFLQIEGVGKVIDSGRIVIQHYTVWLSNGDKIDSLRDRNQPFVSVHPTEKFIKGMNEALSLMGVGDRGKSIMPYYLAYGEKGEYFYRLQPAYESIYFRICVIFTILYFSITNLKRLTII